MTRVERFFLPARRRAERKPRIEDLGSSVLPTGYYLFRPRVLRRKPPQGS